MKTLISYAVLLLVVLSCATKKNMGEQTFWVNSTKVMCMGVGPMQCMQIQKGDRLEDDNWELFYDAIEGFTFVPGNIYKLKIAVENLDPKSIPADASSKKYKLIKVISKKADLKLRLNDIWITTHINGEEIQISNEKARPQLEIKITEENKVTGKAGCNRFFGSIEKLTETQLIFSSKMGSTKMACPDLNIENSFFKALSAVKAYKIENNNLSVFDQNNKEVIRFKKID